MHHFLNNLNKQITSVFILSCLLIAPYSVQVTASSQEDLNYMQKRQQMVRLIEDDVKRTSVYLDKEALDPKVMQAMGAIPRHKFVPESMWDDAYQNNPLPIGHGQTISQPYIVAIMTDLLKLSEHDKVLEIGTGSGYQAAILAQLVNHVYSIEIIEPLGLRAAGLFKQLDYTNISTKIGDGYYGWGKHAPFDAIIVTAAASHIPQPLIQQLKPGGHMMIPVGSQFITQQLLLVTKAEDGHVTTRQILPVLFVPLTGDH
ncbi:MAG: protein-L-isoaspartate(D-aspartate) O-methyltransferase [gamma proteobacterium symbiont of Bathyaustriella thionipta]|nr:protein-L-isoaspartate(D-aspartate) O-methyltransferase [gamma proteobacterium symbiont of Bathyaustriella thionipta]MCU7948774.1 protein-L-isoaspartate(D-aspartate) O-methyltransferase [gamma proteobacterium symbiont of Bathyaustriella thionipta]MCU7954989.1 protein-L-isoaspartate(D-aspartate) O-methyltransferase [gamma proteobacterium symbiont of Bathyaustriella thionipta]MCU7955317.1 protein-L-isoaspartate(D-aspartate) O-methyltransferase [gamma proteobacterium symbiont of Bathyaustriella 